MCKECSFKAIREAEQMRSWGKIPDEFDTYLRRKWFAIKIRCEDPTSRYWHRYGGRGIKLSEEFKDPRVFVEYVRGLPDASKDLQIDRIDNDKGYERGNLRWVDCRTNCNNRSMTVMVMFRGKEIPLSDFVRDHTKLSYTYVRKLLDSGVRADEISSFVAHKKNITYGGISMSLRKFALEHTNRTPTNVRKLYLRGATLDEIARRNKRYPNEICYCGEMMRFNDFVKRFTHLSLPYATKLRRKGFTLEQISRWRKKSDVITYDGKEMHFKDFVRDHTKMSYVYARQMYRSGKSLDEIAKWSRKG